MAEKTVATPSDEVTAMQADWTLVNALLGGTNAMRAAGEKYLPKWPAEQQKDYDCRLKTAVLFPAFQRTVTTLASKPFSKPITIGDDVPAQIQEWLKDADLEGRNLDRFAYDLMTTALGPGLGGILVDYPRADGVRTVADERAAGLRPYMVHIKPEQILGWQESRQNGAWVLTQLRFLECVEEPDGPWDTKDVQQVRVLAPGTWQTWRLSANATTGIKEWTLFEEGTTSLSYIPFVPVYGERTGFLCAKPPLLEVAHLNVAHWQSASDQQTILHVARVPILAVIGAQDGLGSDGKPVPWKLEIGASTAVRIPAGGGDMKFVEHSGRAIQAGADDLEKLEERMRQAGAELLVLKPGHITATQVATENAVGMSALHRITLGLEDALDRALQIMADWVKLPEGGHVSIFNDFGAASLAEASTQILLNAAQANKISDETFFEEMQRRGIISPDVDWEEEHSRIEAQGPALGMVSLPSSVSPNSQQIANANQDQ
jgi:hypothetical protein